MIDEDACSGIKNLFVSYKPLLRRNVLTWMTDDIDKANMNLALSVFRPEPLRFRVKSVLELSNYDLRKDFDGFFAHAEKPSESFQPVDNCEPIERRRDRNNKKATNDDDSKNNCKGDDKDKVGKVGSYRHNSNSLRHPFSYICCNKKKATFIICKTIQCVLVIRRKIFSRVLRMRELLLDVQSPHADNQN